MNESCYQLYAKLVIQEGGTPKPGDSLRALVRKWANAVGATTDALDTKNDLLRKFSIAVGEPTKPGDNDQRILQRISGMPTGSSEWDCLRRLVPSTDVALFDGGEPTLPDESGFLP